MIQPLFLVQIFSYSPSSLFFSPVSPEDIHLLIGDIKNENSVRENDIDNKLLKLSNAVICPILCNIFNSLIQQGEFPDILKVAKVVLVF